MRTLQDIAAALDLARDESVTAHETYTALVTGHGTDEEIDSAHRAMNRARARLNRTRKALAAAQS
jgi:multidrug resistance efflux pump